MFNIIEEGNSVLTTPTKHFDFNNPPYNIDYLIDNMKWTMEVHNGIGLAGPQVNIPYRVFVIDGKVFGEIHHKVFFNAEILNTSEEYESLKEGCLSFPNLELTISRPKAVEARWQNADGNVCQEKFTNMAARCFQHEYDHVDGIVFTQRAKKLTLKLAREKQRKLQKR